MTRESDYDCILERQLRTRAATPPPLASRRTIVNATSSTERDRRPASA